MLNTKRTILTSLLESKDGLHLTAYLVNRYDLEDIKFQLNSVIIEARHWLDSAMDVEEQKKFLEPLYSLLLDASILKQMEGNIGLFRTGRSFQILNVPVEVEQSCQVATSFHVKPLLRWLQIDKEFFLLGLQNDSAHLYFADQDSLRIVDSIFFPRSSQDSFKVADLNKEKNRITTHSSLKMQEVSIWLDDWIDQIKNKSAIKLFLAGDKELLNGLYQHLQFPQLIKTPISYDFSEKNVEHLCSIVRTVLIEDSKRLIQRALLEFRFAEASNRAPKNIFQISKAVVKGQVRKLIISDDLNIFGKINHNSGNLVIHPFDLDHEDDDILDDLAQIVLSQGGEVILAKRSEIPKGFPALAILDREVDDLEMQARFISGDVQHGRSL